MNALITNEIITYFYFMLFQHSFNCLLERGVHPSLIHLLATLSHASALTFKYVAKVSLFSIAFYSEKSYAKSILSRIVNWARLSIIKMFNFLPYLFNNISLRDFRCEKHFILLEIRFG